MSTLEILLTILIFVEIASFIRTLVWDVWFRRFDLSWMTAKDEYVLAQRRLNDQLYLAKIEFETACHVIKNAKKEDFPETTP